MLVNTIGQRVLTSLTTIPVGAQGWYPIIGITAATTAAAGVGSLATGFIELDNFSPPPPSDLWRPLSAFVVPGLLEEVIWRAALLPTPAAPTTLSTILQHATQTAATINCPTTLTLYKTALTVLAVHVASHPVFSAVAYPRGKQVFGDPRFLFLATIVLGGTTLSYIVSGGSVWAAVLTHGLPVALWRDFFGGERALQKGKDA
ncbi:Abortive infection protein [Seminavis robusta]|uniref:Abortive infection protein n=1 Tax=Seminavis robusta TaxID=568900 RepID=A0A9N8HTP8_9STRA|nr:Abortive infection protein [Seminavis robusta]|eukprot:Sro1692_g291540.1 Abortive infection protein (203) ;mRNA; r:14634-15242